MRKIYEEKIRTVKRFLFLPVLIGNEERWLEFAHLEQKYVFSKKWKWVNISFK